MCFFSGKTRSVLLETVFAASSDFNLPLNPGAIGTFGDSLGQPRKTQSHCAAFGMASGAIQHAGSSLFRHKSIHEGNACGACFLHVPVVQIKHFVKRKDTAPQQEENAADLAEMENTTPWRFAEDGLRSAHQVHPCAAPSTLASERC